MPITDASASTPRSIRSTDISSCIQKYKWIGYLEKKWMQSADGDGQQASIMTVALLGIETHLLSGSQILFPVMLVGKTVLGKLIHIITLIITESPCQRFIAATHAHTHIYICSVWDQAANWSTMAMRAFSKSMVLKIRHWIGKRKKTDRETVARLIHLFIQETGSYYLWHWDHLNAHTRRAETSLSTVQFSTCNQNIHRLQKGYNQMFLFLKKCKNYIYFIYK